MEPNDLLTLYDKITRNRYFFRYLMHKTSAGDDRKNTINGLSLTYTRNIRSTGQLFKFNLIIPIGYFQFRILCTKKIYSTRPLENIIWNIE